ncbi:hypothetical protein P879_02694 [Paragonimus westermani]|uniref:Uncharacterized protein n=1 Tax=Paragonimus westermani TaxID=34504 RepID=A0A8T0DRK8_9TREM|nr:hypothetical protein P879_02694 [Paragonimus westermani]
MCRFLPFQPIGDTPFLSRHMDIQTVGLLSAIERSSPPSIHPNRTLSVSTHPQNLKILTNEQRLEVTGAVDNKTTAKQHTSSTPRDVHHLILRPCSPASHLESQACKEKEEGQLTHLDSHALTDIQVSVYCADQITGL